MQVLTIVLAASTALIHLVSGAVVPTTGQSLSEPILSSLPAAIP
jgi:hypothetical protein